MASLGHLAVGLAAARFRTPRKVSRPSAVDMFFWSALSLLPDADVLSFRLGIPYAAPFGHRGFTHSLFFAVLLGVLVIWTRRRLQSPAWGAGLLAMLVVASHPLLDTMTDGGLGCALFWPFSNARYFAPFTPIPVAPLGRDLLSLKGLQVAAVELLLFLPVFYYALRARRN
jgi:inner membrane protein